MTNNGRLLRPDRDALQKRPNLPTPDISSMRHFGAKPSRLFRTNFTMAQIYICDGTLRVRYWVLPSFPAHDERTASSSNISRTFLHPLQRFLVFHSSVLSGESVRLVPLSQAQKSLMDNFHGPNSSCLARFIFAMVGSVQATCTAPLQGDRFA